MDLMRARLNGRTSPASLVGSSARLTWVPSDGPAAPRTVRVRGAADPHSLGSAPTVWNVDVDAAAGEAELPVPAHLPFLFWSVGEATALGGLHRGVVVPNPAWAPASWITSPDWAAEAPADTGSRLFTREIVLPEGELQAAILHLSTPGVAWITVNGHPIPERLTPGYSDYQRSSAAVSIDIAEHLAAGENALAIEIATGMSWVDFDPDRYSKLELHAAPLALAAKLDLMIDGKISSVVTDSTWGSQAGASRTTHWYGGEDWSPLPAAARSSAVPVGPVRADDTWWPEHPAPRVTETLQPLASAQLAPGTTVIDFGANIAGTPRVRGRSGVQGTRLVLRPGELLDDAGVVTQWSTGSPIFHRIDVPPHTEFDWSSRFAFNGFRYLQVEGEWDPRELVFSAEVIHVPNAHRGEFRSANTFVDDLHRVTVRAVRGNMHSMFTDCPHREKLGWLEQLHLCFGALARNFDVEAHLRDALRHVRHAQEPSGAIPNIAPEFVDFSGHTYRGDPNAFREDPNWAAALVQTSWLVYSYSADERILRENWASIEAYLAYLGSRACDDLLDFGLGDWIALEHHTPRGLLASYGYHGMLRTAARIAGVLQHPERADALNEQAHRVRAAIFRVYVPQGDEYAEHTQATLALLHDLSEDPATRTRYADRLAHLVEADGGLISVGEVALPSFLRAYSASGRDAELLALLSDPDLPGYGHQIAAGVTALAETWTARSGPEGEGSQNHFMLGMVEDWILGSVAGLRQHPDDIGWRAVVMTPSFLPGVGSASTAFDSPRGRYALAWDEERGSIVAEAPAGGRAELMLPVDSEWRDEATGTVVRDSIFITGRVLRLSRG